MDLSVFDHNFYFVCYPPGAGGTHLSNLIALDPSFNPKGLASHEEYYAQLLAYYESPTLIAHAVNQHHFDIHNPKWVKILNEYLTSIDVNQYKNSIHTAHINHLFNNRYFENLANRRVILIGFNEQTSLDYIASRERKILADTYPPLTEIGGLNTDAMRYLYSRDYFQKAHTVNDLNLMYIEAKRMSNRNITDLLENINQLFGLSIPMDQADKLHKLWISKNAG